MTRLVFRFYKILANTMMLGFPNLSNSMVQFQAHLPHFLLHTCHLPFVTKQQSWDLSEKRTFDHHSLVQQWWFWGCLLAVIFAYDVLGVSPQWMSVGANQGRDSHCSQCELILQMAQSKVLILTLYCHLWHLKYFWVMEWSSFTVNAEMLRVHMTLWMLLPDSSIL